MASNDDALPFTPGEMIGGKYRVARVVGQGGMGVVAEAVHVQLDERVALKFLRPDMLKMPDVVARFDREARAAVKLKSEHVARVMDVGKTDAGVPYMVMEFLQGNDLAELLSTTGPLPVTQAVEYVIQACEGVGEAHARGIVHRDIKPENLFVLTRSDGWRSIKVLDFGISKTVLLGPSSVDMSSHETHSIMGSPYYMSPEQLRSTKSVDHRADVWSLGVVLFELLTGVMPFDETREFTELVAAVLESPNRKLTDFRFDVPEGLEAVVDKCLEKDRTKRFQTTAELAVSLLPFAPKRARVMAERATSISKAAGLTDPSFQFPPSDVPPASPEAHIPIGALLAPRVPALTPVSTNPPLTSASVSGSIDAPRGSSRVFIGVAALVAVAAVTGIVVARVMRTATPAPAVSAAITASATAPQMTIASTSRRSGRRVLVVDPRDATITFDGARVAPGAQWLEGTRSALLHVEAPGRVPSDRTITFDTDDPIVVRLDPIATHETTAVAHASNGHVPAALPSASAASSASAVASVTPPPPPPPPTVNPTDVGY
jgi:serine/threonine-protein kinase